MQYFWLHIIGTIIWIIYWFYKSKQYIDEHPYGKTYDVFKDPGQLCVFAPFWECGLLGLLLIYIFIKIRYIISKHFQ